MFTDGADEARLLARSLASSTGRLGAAAAAAVRKAAYDIEADAKLRAPVGKTGDLRDSITTTITGDGRRASIQAEIGPTAPYARYVEDGTSVHAPQPYMRPAFERRTPGLEATFQQLGDLLP